MRSPSRPLIDCIDVSREFTLGSTRRWGLSSADAAPTVTAVDQISLSIDRGEVVGLAGPSGSGKSTLLHLLAGLDTPTSGTVSFDGTDLASLSARQRTAHRLTNVGIVFQRFHLLASLSARANVALPLVERGVPKRERRQRATELLDSVGLGDRLTHTPGQLSGGEKQRVAIARAMVTDPDLVIADEPTGELDTETGTQVLDLFTRIADDAAIVIASHDEPTLAIADRVIRLRDGRRIDEDPATAEADVDPSLTSADDQHSPDTEHTPDTEHSPDTEHPSDTPNTTARSGGDE